MCQKHQNPDQYWNKDPLKICLIINTQNSPIYEIPKKISKKLRTLIRSGKSYIKDTKQ